MDNLYRAKYSTYFLRYFVRTGTPDYDLDAVWKRVEDGFESRVKA